jgi:hypothetical protein
MTDESLDKKDKAAGPEAAPGQVQPSAPPEEPVRDEGVAPPDGAPTMPSGAGAAAKAPAAAEAPPASPPAPGAVKGAPADAPAGGGAAGGGGGAGGGGDGAAPPAVVEPAAPAAQSMTLVYLREWTTVVIAVAIVVVALSLLAWAFFAISEPTISKDDVANADLFKAQTDARETVFRNRMLIVNLGLGLLGVVTGYFFGRIPAERRAESAEQTAKTSAAAAEGHAQAAAVATEAKGQAERDEAAKAAELASVKQDALATVKVAKQRMTPAVQTVTTLSDGQQVDSADKENLMAAAAELDALERRLAG